MILKVEKIEANSIIDLAKKINIWLSQGGEMKSINIHEDNSKQMLYTATINIGVQESPPTLKEARLMTGLTRKYVASRLNVSEGSVKNYEEKGFPLRQHLDILSDLYGLRYDYVVKVNRELTRNR